MKDANRQTSRGQSSGSRKPDPAAMEKYMRGQSNPQGQQDYQDATQSQAMSPEEAGYQEQPGQCDGCTNMAQDGTCAVLKMQVEPDHYCNQYSPSGEAGDEDEDQQAQAAPAAPSTAAGGQGGPVGF